VAPGCVPRIETAHGADVTPVAWLSIDGMPAAVPLPRPDLQPVDQTPAAVATIGSGSFWAGVAGANAVRLAHFFVYRLDCRRSVPLIASECVPFLHGSLRGSTFGSQKGPAAVATIGSPW